MPRNSPMTRVQKQILVFSLLIIFLIGVLVYIFRDQTPPPASPDWSTPTVSIAPEATYATVNEALDNLPSATPTPTPTNTPAPAPVITPTSAPEFTINPETYATLRKNDAGPEVKKMQQKLIELGYLKAGGDDGDFGNGTFTAVKKFQKRNNLTADGIAGSATLSALYGPNPVRAE
ncbi:MAG: peptidoglycan-binding domain-containing protein [Christensenellales bacterium]|jgi:hypothetical protein